MFTKKKFTKWNTPAMFLVPCPYPTPYPKLELDSLRVLAKKERDRSPRVFCRQLFIQRFRWLVALFVAVSLMSRKNTRASSRLGSAPPCMDFLFIEYRVSRKYKVSVYKSQGELFFIKLNLRYRKRPNISATILLRRLFFYISRAKHE